MMIRKAVDSDIDAIAAIYERIHAAEEAGESTTGWKRSIYPVRETAAAALRRDDLFVIEEDGSVIGSGILNQNQVDVYAEGRWEYTVEPSRVMVMHTLVIDPQWKHRGYGKRFVRFYEDYALKRGCFCLRIDTNEKNTAARSFYQSLGFKEIGIVPCVFNGLRDVNLVLLEKCLK